MDVAGCVVPEDFGLRNFLLYGRLIIMVIISGSVVAMQEYRKRGKGFER